MKKNSKYKFFKIYFIVFVSAYFNVILSLSSFSQSDSLLSYLEIAAKNNPTVLQRYYEYEAAVQKVPQVGSLPDPQFDIGVFISPMELVDGKQVADLRLMQMFPWFGVIKSAKDEMSLMAKAKFESFRDAKLQVYYEVKRSWYEMQKIKNDIRISEQNVEILQTIERLTLVKYKAGPAAGSNFSPSGGSGLTDLYRIQIEIGDLKNNIALLNSQLLTASARFNAFLNRVQTSPVYLPDTLMADSLGLSVLAVQDSILSHNPMLDMLSLEQQSLEARKKMVTRMGYPMLGLGVNYSIISKTEVPMSNMNGKDMIMPMATLTLPIYRKKYNAMKSEADLLKTATGENYKATANTLQTDYYEALQLYQDALRRMELFENQGNLTKQTLDIMLVSYSTGGPALADILQIRQQILDYQLDEIEAIADYNTAIAWLERLGNEELH